MSLCRRQRAAARRLAGPTQRHLVGGAQMPLFRRQPALRERRVPILRGGMGRRVLMGAMVAALLAVLLVAVPSLAQQPIPLPGSSTGLPDANTPPVRASEPIVMTGQQFPGLSAPANQTAKLPLTDLIDCHTTNTDTCPHNHYDTTGEVDTGKALGSGTPVDRLLGYRWDDKTHKFVQIP